MKRLIYISLILTFCITLSSCFADAYLSDGEVVNYGQPFYYNGYVRYYYYHGHYYYPYHYGTTYHYYRYSRPIPPPRYTERRHNYQPAPLPRRSIPQQMPRREPRPSIRGGRR